MAIEIERKYLVKSEQFKAQAQDAIRIKQGYLCSVKERTVRVRIKADQGYITVKGIGNASGTCRYEWEKQIPVVEAQALLDICEPGLIDKTRYLVLFQGHTFEVDEFYGDNQGLVVAEVELEDEHQKVYKPSWLGQEVTGESKYYNSQLMKIPYRHW